MNFVEHYLKSVVTGYDEIKKNVKTYTNSREIEIEFEEVKK